MQRLRDNFIRCTDHVADTTREKPAPLLVGFYCNAQNKKTNTWT